jgi:hypothetical protein
MRIESNEETQLQLLILMCRAMKQKLQSMQITNRTLGSKNKEVKRTY